jgi:hypothetical protein
MQAIIFHDGVGGTLDEVQASEIAKMSLVKTGEVEKVGRVGDGSDRTSVVPDGSRNVVKEASTRVVHSWQSTSWMRISCWCATGISKFQVRIGDGTMAVGWRWR